MEYDVSDIFFTLIYLGCCFYAFFKGFRKPFIILALFMALIFQYVLGFSLIAKITMAAIFLLYFVLPDIRAYFMGKDHFEDQEYEDVDSQDRSGFFSHGISSSSRSTKSQQECDAQQSVFEEFEDMSRKRREKKKPKT